MEKDIAIKIDNISKVYHLQKPQLDPAGNLIKELWVLRNLSFTIKKGDRIGIIGHNGCGKSTLLKILAGVTKPHSGKIEIQGKVASILDIGAGFHPELSGKENVFLNAQLYGFSSQEIKEKYKAIVDFSGVGNFIYEPVKNYSNGMYLRLAFSIMAHLDFDIYLFDEVLNVGDEQFKYISGTWMKNNQKTIVIVSHQFQEMLTFVSDVYKLNENELVKIEDDFQAGPNQTPSRLKNIKFSRFPKHMFDIKLVDYHSKVKVKFTYAEPIFVRVRFNENLMYPYVIGIIVKSINNIYVFESSFNTSNIQAPASFIAEISSCYFNNMKYKIDLVLIKEKQIVGHLEDVARFEVFEANKILDSNTWGVVMPNLTWKRE